MLKLRTSVRERESSSSSSIGIPHKGARGGFSPTGRKGNVHEGTIIQTYFKYRWLIFDRVKDGQSQYLFSDD